MRRGWSGICGMMIAITCWLVGTAAASAEQRPIKQLPQDVVRWSTMWWAIPKEMVEVGQEHGPLAAMIWGPTKGTAVMMSSTSKELIGAMKDDQRPDHRAPSGAPKGPIFQYEF